MRKLYLYSSEHCCLCDDALEIIEAFENTAALELIKRDIYTDKSLLIKYRLHIPVVCDESSGDELYWPFTEQEFARWFQNLA